MLDHEDYERAYIKLNKLKFELSNAKKNKNKLVGTFVVKKLK